MEPRKGSIVGRASEIAEIMRGFEDAASGRGRVYVIAGEGGIGKTRLATEIARLAIERGATVAWGRCAEAGGAPAFWPWIQILRSLRRARARGPAREDARTASLERLLPELRGGDAASGIVDPTEARLALFEDVVETLRDVAEPTTPLALVFEDLHVADPSTLALVHFLAREIVDAPILLLVTLRDQEVRSLTDRGEAVHRIARESVYLPLRRFGAAEVRELLERHAGQVASAVVDRVFATTEGNVLFVEEVARALAAGEDAAATLPSGVRDAIGKRLARLDGDALLVLGAASVVGRKVDVALLEGMLEGGPEDVRLALERAEAAAIITWLGAEAFAFSHVLVRDVVYRDLPPRKRAELHAKIADALALSNAPERAASQIATHLLDALEAVGSERAFRGSLDAARFAAQAFAFEDVIAIVEKAVAVVGPDRITPRHRAEGLVVIGEARMRTGAVEAGRAACNEAAAIARSIGDPKLLAAAALACGAEIAVAQVDGTLVTLLDDALRLLPAAELGLRARVLARLAGAEQPAADPNGPMDRAREAIALARESGDRFALRMALQFGGSALADFAHPQERAPLDAEMRDLAIEAGDTPSVFRAQLRLFFDHLELGDRGGAVACADEIQRIADTLGWSRMRASATMTRACLAAHRGAFSEALGLVDLARGPAGAQRETELQFRIGVAFLQDHAELIESMTSELDELWGTASAWLRQWVHLLTAGARARLDDVEGARSEVAKLPKDSPCFWADPGGMQMAAELAALLGDADWARELHPRAVRFASRFVSWGQHAMIALYPFSIAVGQLEATLERWPDAFASFEAAERHAAGAGALPALAWSLYWHAWARAKKGEGARAGELASRATTVAREIGLGLLVARIAALPTSDAAAASAASRPPSARRVDVGLAFAFRLSGEVWTVETPGQEIRLKDSRGMRMLARLVQEPEREMHVLLLASEGADPGDLGSAGEVIDVAAVKSYRGRIDDLRDGIEEAERFSDPGRADKLREELDFLVRELAAGVGLGGRSRKAASAAERARVNVQRRLRDAIRRIGEHSPALGEYLGWTIRTGTFCSYRPAGSRPA
jgi:hypothetical protein